MAKVSKELSKPGRENMHPVGLKGGRGPKDINGPGENEIKAVGQATEIADMRDDNDNDGD